MRNKTRALTLINSSDEDEVELFEEIFAEDEAASEWSIWPEEHNEITTWECDDESPIIYQMCTTYGCGIGSYYSYVVLPQP